jgi:hypothetical protein
MRPRLSPALALILLLGVLVILGLHYEHLLLHVIAGTALAAAGGFLLWFLAVSTQTIIVWAWHRPISPPASDPDKAAMADDAANLADDETLVVATVNGELPEVNSRKDETPL